MSMDDGLGVALLQLVRMVEESIDTSTLMVCIAVLATLLIATSCCALRLRCRLTHMAVKCRSQQAYIASCDRESECGQLHRKKAAVHREAPSPSAEQDYGEDDSA